MVENHPDIINNSTKKNRRYSSGRRTAREILLLCASADINPEQKDYLSGLLSGTADWDYLLELAEFNGITPLVAHTIVAGGLSDLIPQHYLDKLNQVYNGTLYKNIIFSNELTNILEAFSKGGIDAIALKGTVLAEQLYGNPALRSIVDIDILVKPEQLSKASALLIEMGYSASTEKQEREHPFHDTYFRQVQFPLFVELHWNLDDSRLIGGQRKEIWERAQSVAGSAVRVLSPEDNLLFLSNHLTKQDDQLLKCLGDIVKLLKKYNGTLDWDYVIQSSRSCSIENSVYYCLKLAHELLGGPLPAADISVLQPKKWRRFLQDFLVSREHYITPSRLQHLRYETFTVFRSLMMRNCSQMGTVLTRYRGSRAIWGWLKTYLWIFLVSGAALGRNIARMVCPR